MSSTDPAPGPLEAVLAALDLERLGADEFRGATLPQLNGRVYGGQVLAQSLIAAEQTVPAGRLAHSLHGYFLRPGDLDEPVTFTVERMRDGRSFSARRTHAVQFGKPILSMIASFQEDQPGLVHAEPMPVVPGPDELPSSVDLFSAIDHPAARFFYRNGAFDMRHVQPQLFTGPDPERSTTQQLWLRARSPVRADQGRQRALLAYACDQVMLEPIMRAHGLSWLTRGASVASLDHAMWWHRDVDLSEWLLFSQSTPSAQGGRGLGAATVYSRDGRLVATMAQEGMIRVPEGSGD
ncbi:acyl-CoA thioesterase II [Pseudactinotalea sp. HY158]|uniref:acyl-CoA thioesterase n=1 Tax=Pseudactinotalea sp. HY158 TaxID=2654547 RepID=UPI00129C266B|nr:acyl-CoA thioesterase II [Pseudactinotalea sp. HY158]QGH70128.1 acyl-CoA thioesterase II [Pseudactinotalea sp. HY158]